MKYKNIIVPKRGGPEVLQVIENDLHPPSAGEARIRILATLVCQDDIAARISNRPFLPKIPFVPGYSILGVVDAIGERLTRVTIGDCVAALTKFWGYAEYNSLGRHIGALRWTAEFFALFASYRQVHSEQKQPKPMSC